MKPPDGDARTYIGLDDANGLWLLAWALPGAPGVWSAFGLDHRRYPCVRTLVGEFEGMIVKLLDPPAADAAITYVGKLLPRADLYSDSP